MGSEKRARQKENRRARLEAERRTAHRAKWRRRAVMWSAIAVLAVGVFLVGNLITGGGPEPPPAVTDTTIPGTPISLTDTTAPNQGSEGG